MMSEKIEEIITLSEDDPAEVPGDRVAEGEGDGEGVGDDAAEGSIDGDGDSASLLLCSSTCISVCVDGLSFVSSFCDVSDEVSLSSSIIGNRSLCVVMQKEGKRRRREINSVIVIVNTCDLEAPAAVRIV